MPPKEYGDRRYYFPYRFFKGTNQLLQNEGYSIGMETRNFKQTTGKYLRELSVIVVGIIITVGAGLWINNRNSEKDFQEYLTAVKLEMEDNANFFDWYAKFLQKSVGYAEYIKTNDKKSLNKDSLWYYAVTDSIGCGYMNIRSINNIKTNAFEMFKISGAMRQMKNKELLLSIWGAYTKMEDANIFLNTCFQMKREEAMKEMQLEVDGKPVAVPMQLFYSTDLPQAMVRQCEDASMMLRESLSKLEK